MKKAAIVAVIAAFALILAACTPEVTVDATQSTGDGQQSGIAVSGIGEVTGTPDTLTMSFGVSVLADSVSVAVDQAAVKADAVINTLEANGVDESDIQTTNYSIQPQYDWQNDEQILIGYRVNNTVTAKLHDISAAGDTIDAVAAAGGDEVTVSGVSFSIEDNEQLIEAAREVAWNDAKSKAEQLAALSGVSLGDPITISESYSTQPQPVEYRLAAESFSDDGAATTPISPGQQQVSVGLQVQFAINN